MRQSVVIHVSRAVTSKKSTQNRHRYNARETVHPCQLQGVIKDMHQMVKIRPSSVLTKILPRILRCVPLALGLLSLPGRGASALTLKPDGGDQTLDVGALGDGLALFLELAGDHVLPHVILLYSATRSNR